MNNQTKVIGVILAGGRARRMNNRDKGLVEFKGRPMIAYAIDALMPVVDYVFINANRNIDQYRQFGLPVISDQTENFDGPLAGILSAMIHVEADVLIVVPCDSPLIKTEHLRRLLLARSESNADVAVAFDGARLHPVFLAIKTVLKTSLQDYLADGQRKVEFWLNRHNIVRVDFSDQPEIFSNINTMAELSELIGTKYLD
ncbi:MAG: molybdenum cofactor guanylyltransferase MobA [Methylobacter sp.]